MSRQVFYFAVKPGCEPVQIASLSAHDRLPWVARGYGCFTFYETGCLRLSEDEEIMFDQWLYEVAEEQRLIDFIERLVPACVCVLDEVDAIEDAVNDIIYGCVAKSVAKSTDADDQDDASAI